ncbi:MAG: DUF3054 domain-containing protein [Pseudarthrobacter sp.]|nr:DUF3054 domain-containing protein [Pseudarthrobacter sp.]
MSSMKTQPANTAPAKTIVAAAVADLLLILAFAAIGRDAHHREDPVMGVFLTAWPFLAGAALGWIVARAWRSPLSVRRAGLAVWLGSLVGGMLLRALTGQTVVLPFVIVATLSLAVFLVGYRLLVAAAAKFRNR